MQFVVCSVVSGINNAESEAPRCTIVYSGQHVELPVEKPEVQILAKADIWIEV